MSGGLGWLRHIKARPRLLIAMTAGALLFAALPQEWRLATRLLAAWNSAAGLYMILAMTMMAQSSIEKIRWRAAQQDEGRIAILALTTMAALASIAAMVAELAAAKTLHQYSGQHIALAGLTIILSWSFMQTMFALHYAHEFYSENAGGGQAEGLEFPGHEPPDYWDFMYYSFVIGTAVATADVNILSRTMRRTTGVHCVVAFFFNTTILALTVNIGAGLF